MAALKAGDKVKVVTREVTAEDKKNGLYYDYFGGLTGTVDRVYDDDSICVDIDLESLTEEARDRHNAIEEAEKNKWLDSLSNEARNRLAPEHLQLRLSHMILINKNDLEPFKGGKPKSGQDKSEDSASKSDTSAQGPSGAQSSQEPKTSKKKEESAKRLSEADLSAAEEKFLKSIKQK